MPVREILLLGNPILRKKCSPLKGITEGEVRALIADLKDTLADFRSRKGFGRGIAAPQIGSSKQVIFLNYEIHGALINPRITKRSKRTFLLWDDCFSFPDILVKVARNETIAVSYLDESGTRRKINASGALSELLQHEIDHLNGVLAIDRAIDVKHIILRSEFEKLPQQQAMTL